MLAISATVAPMRFEARRCGSGCTVWSCPPVRHFNAREDIRRICVQLVLPGFAGILDRVSGTSRPW